MYCFSNCKRLKSVIIPSTVTEISQGLFENCVSLNNVNLTEGLTIIHKSAFNNCTALEGVRIPSTVTEIRSYAFSNCSSLENIAFPDKIENLDIGVLSGCTALTSVVIGSRVNTINYYCFSNCTSLKSITIPSSVATIILNAFDGCTSLEEFLVSSGNQRFSSDDGVLYSKDKTTLIRYPLGKKESVFTVPISTSKIGEKAFSQVVGTRRVVLLSSIKAIPAEAFRYSEIQIVDIPSSVLTMGEYAFDSCSKMEYIVLPPRMKSLPNNAFSNCTALKRVELSDTITEIGDYCFKYCRSLKSIDLNMVKKIGKESFGNIGLTEVVFPETITYIGAGAFVNNNKAKYIFHNGIEKIDSYAIGYETENGLYKRRSPFNKIYGFKDSVAEKYAKDNNISFIAIDNKYFATVEEPPKADVEIEPIPVPKISATKLSLKAGYSRTLKVTNGKVKEWRTSNKNVVKVASGKVTAIRKGTATVTAILTSGKKLYCKITVTTSPTLNRTSVILKPKQSYTLKITGKVGTAKFSTTNSKVAGVYQSGRILAKRKGAAYITVKTNGITLKCKVIVK